MTPTIPEISVVVPVYNEQDCLAELHTALRRVLDALGRPHEILLIDDGSTDNSPAILRRIADEDPTVRVVRFRRNAGQSAAFQAGFDRARGEAVVTLDADLQNDPEDIPAVLEGLKDADAVCGIRARRRDTWVRRLTSRIGNGARNWALGEDIVDTGCSLKAFRREILRGFRLFNGMHRFLPTMVRLAGGRVVQVPVNHHPRHAGVSKYGLRNRALRTTLDLLAVMWMKSRWLRYQVEE